MKKNDLLLLLMLICFSFFGFAQKQVSGLVTNEQGVPALGVTVLVKNTNTGAVTDFNGAYSVEVSSGSNVLVFSYIGMKTQEIQINQKSEINVQMVDDLSALDDVVVIGYGTQKRESVLAAVSTVRVDELTVAAPRSIANVMAGQIPGIISVQRSGEPGRDDAQFWIRGISTFGAGSEPLVLVDGVERSISNVVADDIASFSVLKDAAATAIYGIKGANGVILVTTRRGKIGTPTMSVTYERGYQNSISMPEFADAPTYLELLNEARLADNPFYQTPYTPEVIEKHRSGVDPWVYPNVDWIDETMNDYSDNQKITANISGGTEKARYFISGTYYNEKGIMKTDPQNDYDSEMKLDRFNFRTNFDLNIRKDLELNVGIGGYLLLSNGTGGYDNAEDLWQKIMLATPAKYAPTAPDPEDPNRHVYLIAGGSGNFNPYAELVNTGYQRKWENTLQTDIGLKYDAGALLEGLRAGVRFSYDAYSYTRIRRVRNGDRWVLHNNPYRDPETGELNIQKDYPGSQVLSYQNPAGGNRRVYFQADLNYKQQFGDHSFSGLLLTNFDDYQNGSAGSATGALPFRQQGIVSRITYQYLDRYLMEVNAGYNGSENFAKGKRYGFFPAAAIGWIASEEPMFQNLVNWNLISFLKFRASIGLKGNDKLSGGRRFAYQTTLGGGLGGYPFGQNVNVNWGQTGEDEWGADLTWEKEQEINLGIETRFLDGFNLQLDVFHRYRDGIFTQRNTLPAIVGTVNNPWANVGEFENSGLDMSLEYRKQIGDFGITMRGNYTFARNNLIENEQPDYIYSYQSRKEKRLGQPFGLIADGLFTSKEEIDSSPEQTFGAVRVGDIKYVDVNGDGQVDIYDEVAIGNPVVPEIVYGFGVSMDYHNFDLSIFFQGVGNVSFMLGGDGFFPFQRGEEQGNLLQFTTDRWTPENPSQDVLFPRLSDGPNTNNYRSSTWWQRDASYMRLKTAELGYTLPKSLTSKLNVSTFRLYLSALNPLTFSKFDYWDPELGNGNGARYPIQKVLTLGTNINF